MKNNPTGREDNHTEDRISERLKTLFYASPSLVIINMHFSTIYTKIGA